MQRTQGPTAMFLTYRQTSNISRTLGDTKSDVVGASTVGAAPTASSFST